MKRTLSLILAAIMTAAALASCGSESASAPTGGNTDPVNAAAADNDTAVPETTAKPAVPDTDWEGREFRVLGYRHDRPQFCNFEIDTDSENGEVVNDAIYRRNRAIEEKYNVTIHEIIEKNDDIGGSTSSVIKKSVTSGDDLYDLAFCTISGIGPLARNGMLVNMYDLEYIDYSKPYWNEDVNDTLSVLGKLYFTSSDFSLRDKNRTHIMIYNRAMVADFGLGDIVKTVDDGKWTYDVLAQWASAVASDLNGNGTIDSEDRFGVGVDSYNSFPSFVASCNIVSVKNDENGVPQLNLNSEYTVSALDKIMALTSDPAVTTFCNDWEGKVSYDFWSASGTFFKEGRALLITSFPHSLSSMSSTSDIDYGVVPYPKYDENQSKYYTFANDYCMLFCVPLTCPDTAFTGFMLEALSSNSQDTLNAYYEVSCKTKYTYDEDSARMLDVIFDGIIFDPAVIYSISGANDIFKTVGRARTNNFATVYAKVESRAQKDIDKLVTSISELG